MTQDRKDKKKDERCKPENGKDTLQLKPEVVLVILGLLSESLEIKSILVDRDQRVQIILEGSLKKKTTLDKVMDYVGQQPFDEVLKALLNRG